MASPYGALAADHTQQTGPYNTPRAGVSMESQADHAGGCHERSSGPFDNVNIETSGPEQTTQAAKQNQSMFSVRSQKVYSSSCRWCYSKKKTFQKLSYRGRLWMIFKYLLFLGVLVLVCVALSKLIP